jgi:hypothetical protein
MLEYCSIGTRRETAPDQQVEGRSHHIKAWYQEHFGIKLEPFGCGDFRWPDDKAEDKGVTVWHVAERDTTWFNPSESSFMINYRVDDLGGMIANLEAAGVKIVQGPSRMKTEHSRRSWTLKVNKTGRIVTETNLHFLTDAELQEWERRCG